ncbi:hypothetical protein EDD11_006437 [Mortierella claussenii]|nr:hypothetical protein EDD11_006437 [Mortierella claussenii]
MDCIEPAALTLNGNQGSSTYSLSPVLPSQDSRRDSVCSLTMGDYDDEHMRVMFERNLAISIPPLPMAVCTSSEHSTTSQAFVQDFVMPDGTIYRFDGTDLVPVPSTHFSNLTSLEETSPVVPSMPKFSNNAFFHQTLMSLAAPEVSMTMYCSELAQPAPEKPARRVNSRILRTGPAKKSSLRKSPLVRRGSADSAYSSSSSSSASQSRQQTTSHSSDASTQNDNTSNSKYRKEGAGEYQCPFENCTYRYNLRRELNRHRNVHLFAGKDKYRCMNCNSGLCRLDSVKRHMEAKGKSECLKMGLYQEFRDNGELVKVRKCKATWYEAAAANAAAGGYGKV